MIFKKIGMQFVSYNEKNMDKLTVELEKAYEEPLLIQAELKGAKNFIDQ